MKRTAWLLATIATFAFALTRVTPLRPSTFAINTTEHPVEPPLFETRVASTGVTPSVHSATAVELSDGKIRAFWYGGSREGAPDVAIYSSVFDPEPGQWSREVVATTRAETQTDARRYVKKLGNPVVSRDQDGRLWLFYVSVAVGGWSGSAINFRISEDEGESWSAATRLVTSPFLNLSTLVRGPAVLYADGTQGLPVYHELLGKFGEYIRLDPDGRILDKARMSFGYSALQPVVVPLDSTRAIGLMRSSGNSPRRVLSVATGDGGSSWSEVTATALNNPDSALAALRLSAGELLIAFNDSEHDRSNLSLALSEDDGDSWELIHVFEPEAPEEGASPRFAYPWLLDSTRGELYLLYTRDRNRIVHVRFNRAWLLRNR